MTTLLKAAAPALPTLPVLAAGQVTEFALVTVRDPGTYPDLHARTLERLSAEPGFVRSYGFRSLSRPELFLDVVVWAALAQAHAAAESVMARPAFASFFAALAESLLMGHFRDAESHVFAPAVPGDVVEAVVFPIRPEMVGRFRAGRPAFVSELAKGGVARSLLSARSASDPAFFLDMALWPSVEAAKAEEARLLVSAAGKAAFALAGGPPVAMDFFTLYEILA